MLYTNPTQILLRLKIQKSRFSDFYKQLWLKVSSYQVQRRRNIKQKIG